MLDEVAANQDEHRDGAISLPQFCEWASIGRTTAYAEIKSGRLRAKKCGSRTLITWVDARQWLSQLRSKSPCQD